jgi:hypothetical protein
MHIHSQLGRAVAHQRAEPASTQAVSAFEPARGGTPPQIRAAGRNESLPSYAREFYDFQFDFPETRTFFERYAQKKGVSLAQLRERRWNKRRRGIFLDIFREAQQRRRLRHVDFFTKRLRIGYTHNVIDLPMKWYLGSYGLSMPTSWRTTFVKSEEIPTDEEGLSCFKPCCACSTTTFRRSSTRLS